MIVESTQIPVIAMIVHRLKYADDLAADTSIGDIVRDYLELHEFDGLFNDNGQCACRPDDLAPCGNICAECRPGYLALCPATCGEHDWHIQKEKPNAAHD